MIKLRQILTEGEMTPVFSKILNKLVKMGIDSDDLGEIYTTLKEKLLIPSEMAEKLTIIYKQYYDVLVGNDMEDPDFKELVKFDIDYARDDIDAEILAISQHLDIHPYLIEKDTHGDYRDVISDEEWLVYTESEANEAALVNAREYVEDAKESDSTWLESYLTMNESAVSDLAQQEAEYMIYDGGYDNEQIIELVGAEHELADKELEIEEKQEERDVIDDRIGDLETKLEDYDYDVGEYDTTLTDLMGDIESSSDQDEISELKNEYQSTLQSKEEMVEQYSSLEEMIEDLRSEYELLDEEIDNMGDFEEEIVAEHKDDAVEILRDQLYDRIESEGLDYFVGELGYEKKDAIESFFDVDEEAAAEDMVNSDGRAHILSHYDGDEHQEDVDGTTYILYRAS